MTVFRGAYSVVVATVLTAGCASPVENVGSKLPQTAAIIDPEIHDAITNAVAIESNEASDENAPHDSWCWTRAGRRDAALKRIAEETARVGNFEAFSEAAELIENANVRAMTFASATEFQSPALTPTEIQYLVASAEISAARMEIGSCRDIVWAKLAEAQANGARIEAAFQTLTSIEDEALRGSVEYRIASAQVAMGNDTIVNAIESPAAYTMILTEIANEQIETGDEAAARKTLAGAQAASDDLLPRLLIAGTPTGLADISFRMLPYYMLMKVYARLGDVDGVMRATEDLQDVRAAAYGEVFSENVRGQDRDAIELLAEAYARAGDKAKALAAANELADSDGRTQLLQKISEISKQ